MSGAHDRDERGGRLFLGHFGVGFGAKRAAPTVSLGTLFLACQLPDLVWPVLVLLGVEVVDVVPGITAVTPLDFVFYPYSHSLVAGLVWAAMLALAHRLLRRPPVSVSLTLAAVVLSHWVLDVISHRPDVPLALGGGPMLGLGLWRSVAATVAVEGAIFLVGVWLYVRATEPRNRTGRWALVGLVAFLVVIDAASLRGPPPPSDRAVAAAGLATWLLVAWGYWVDRNRSGRTAPAAMAELPEVAAGGRSTPSAKGR
jgi:hypothetical protein